MMEADETIPLEREAHRNHCRTLQAQLLGNRALIIASNRAPVAFERDQDGNLTFQRGGGGLVTALTDLCRHTDATWIACAQNEADSDWGEGD
ncbi:MAG: hypothetical protein P8Z40_11705, partial [Chloroflexota bacterium]